MTTASCPSARRARDFVGRERELEDLRLALDEARAERGGLFLISGEPGIGKTGLAEELAAEARSRGDEVLWGSCWDGGGAPAYWPWVQVIRHCLRRAEAGSAAELMTRGAVHIAQIVPEVRDRLSLSSAVPPSRSLEHEHSRFDLFDAVTTLLRLTSRTKPLLIVLDDLHVADPASVKLLRFFAQGLRDSRILAIGTFRDAEARRHGELSKILSRIARGAQRMTLAGWSEREVGRFLAVGCRAPEHDVVSAVYNATGGNPFFVGEIPPDPQRGEIGNRESASPDP